jgi:hypothetical protein
MTTAKKTTTTKTSTTPRKSTTTRTRKTTPVAKTKIKAKAPSMAEFIIKRADNGFVLDIASDSVYNQLVFSDESDSLAEVVKKVNETILKLYGA